MTTSFGTGGNLGGIAGADFRCLTRAKDAGLPGEFKAWLTDASPDTAPATRFESTSFTGWYLGTDGTPIAHGWDDLTSLDDNQTDYLKAPIRADENGDDIGSDASVWTNTGPDGLQDPANQHCKNWNSSSAGDMGAVGLSSQDAQLEPSTIAWTQFDTEKCSANDSLYCFQTAP